MSDDLAPSKDVTPVGEILDAELVEEQGAVTPVNPPPTPGALPWRLGEPIARPVIPTWLIDAHQRGEAARWAVRFAQHWAAYHSVRSPIYLLRMMAYAPRGAKLLTWQIAGWLTDSEARPLRAVAVAKQDHETYLKLARVRADRVRFRRVGAAVGLVCLVGVAVALGFAPVWAQLLAAAVTILGLSKLGRPKDRPIMGTAVVIPQAPRLTDKKVSEALAAIGVKSVTFSAPICRDGPGWRAAVELPLGTTVAHVVDRRDQLASALRRPLGCVWAEPEAEGHPGQLVLWVGDRDLSKQGLVRWPLATSGQHDYFQPAPFGADQRGRQVKLPLYQHNVLIGSLPGQGKTGAVRCLACAAALDPTAELWLHELKGSGDLDPLERVAHRYASGIDDESVAYAAESLHLLRAEVMRRAAAVKSLPRDLCPDKRITREIAERRQLRLHPLVCVIDECQNLFAHPDWGGQAGDDATFIIKIGRAFGVSLILATQRPDKDSLPTGVSGNVSIRFCLKVAGQVENDMILGTSAYKNGLRATTLRAEIDAGIGYLVGATAEPVVCRVAYLDQVATERVAQRARALREAAGTITGHAAGEEPERTPAASLLDDLRVVFATAERIWSEDICARLAELRPQVYGGWDPKALAAALKPYGITTEQVWIATEDGSNPNRRGLRREQVHAAVENHQRRQISGPAERRS